MNKSNFLKKHLLFPILPGNLIGYCTSKVPFIIGLHSSKLDELNKLSTEDYLFVDLDKGTLTASPSIVEDMKSIPQFLLNKISELNIQPPLQTPLQIEKACMEFFKAFLEFIFTILVDYFYFFEFDENSKIFFNYESFLNYQSREYRNFCEYFCKSSLFHSFIREIIYNFENNLTFSRSFDRDCADWAFTNPKGFFINIFSNLFHINLISFLPTSI